MEKGDPGILQTADNQRGRGGAKLQDQADKAPLLWTEKFRPFSTKNPTHMWQYPFLKPLTVIETRQEPNNSIEAATPKHPDAARETLRGSLPDLPRFGIRYLIDMAGVVVPVEMVFEVTFLRVQYSVFEEHADLLTIMQAGQVYSHGLVSALTPVNLLLCEVRRIFSIFSHDRGLSPESATTGSAEGGAGDVPSVIEVGMAKVELADGDFEGDPFTESGKRPHGKV